MGVNEQTKVLCRCPKGYCFLEEDAARAKQNYAARAPANRQDAAFRSRAFQQLDDERLRRKSEWLESLGVAGTLQVQCRKEGTEAW